jgi:hypothetical protein
MQLNLSQGSGMTYSQVMQNMESMQFSQVITQLLKIYVLGKKMQKMIEVIFHFFSKVKSVSWI